MHERERRRNRNRRVFIVLLGMSAVLAVYILRLAWLQLTPGAPALSRSINWKREAVAQRERGLMLDSGRGDFVDRSGIAVTGESYQGLAVFPLQAGARNQGQQGYDFAKLASALGIEARELQQWMEKLKAPAFWQAQGETAPHKLSKRQQEAIAQLRLDGVRVLPYRNRYPSYFHAKHVIGYISQHPELLQTRYERELSERKMKLTDRVGGAGLEKSLDGLLRGAGATSVSYFTDGSDKPLKGLDIRLTGPDNPYYPLKIVTTLDLPLQNKIEAYMDAQGLVEGAVVVLDAGTGDIVAMASRPKLAPASLKAAGSDMANHAVRAATPGSIFKLVTAAAALEAGLTREREQFECDGDYGRYGLHCWKEGGHGRITLHEALAQSCNIVFATIAERLTPAQLAVTADKLGIGRKIGWYYPQPFSPLGKPLRLLPEEEAGTIFNPFPTRKDGGQLAQSGIGQRDVTLSPLQAANLIVTLLHGGRVAEPRLVSEIRYANGQVMAALPRRYAPSRYGGISRRTANALLSGMEAVVTVGTGHSIQKGVWQVAGKSGTAETLRTGVKRNNQWFTGYGPLQSPRYTVAVLAENRSPESPNQATVLFRGIMDILAEETTLQQDTGKG
ncbi:peptidoglycan D,D-transpeptidase FtsI family protein [Paenibacillus nasutitermitis]|uniref:Penicillin-binding protein 4B n=1 Tax=Paenibacillus nasutitermitis TaxID=1652958 RepID=A0A917DVX4_9BACL|nr:penicillin-binding protein 2 [Paenibacillus nasutitermitis]GGD73742.1 penicillin-binding protein 4B [Paenibacillus nasutitermitis]